jgi:hypothetical protein
MELSLVLPDMDPRQGKVVRCGKRVSSTHTIGETGPCGSLISKASRVAFVFFPLHSCTQLITLSLNVAFLRAYSIMVFTDEGIS